MFLMQIHNFVRFCELLVKSCPKLEGITLTTGEGDVSTHTTQCMGILPNTAYSTNEVHKRIVRV